MQGHIVRREGQAEIWAGKRLFDGSQAVLVFNPGTAPAEVQVAWADIGARNLPRCMCAICGRIEPRDRTAAASPSPCLRATWPCFASPRSRAFPLPPVIVADSYWLSFRAPGPGPQKLTGAITVKTTGSDELPLWKVRPGFPPGYPSP